MNNGKQPINPIFNSDGFASEFSSLDNLKTAAIGLTKREYFAGLAMASFFGGEFIGQSGMPEKEIAKRCVAMADALLAELSIEDGQ
jgi:hypothetical protein